VSDEPAGPYDILEPGEDGPGEAAGATPSGRDPGAAHAILRGLTKRCPRCGERKVFVHWLKVAERCPRCGLRMEREEGGFLGAMTINYAVTTLVWVVFLVVWLAIDLPDVRVLPLTVASVVLVGVLPLVLYPFSKTTWAAVDYLVFRSDPDHASRDPGDRSSGNGGRY
jgi:uncharacterized protein (DUF983 family)